MVITRNFIFGPALVRPMSDAVGRALEALRRGEFVLVYDGDGREAETDMTIASQFVTPDAVRVLRREAGGLICTTVPAEAREKIGLPFLSELFSEAAVRHPVLARTVTTSAPYDAVASPFSITINHRDTRTGVTDRDRALTISRFAALVEEALRTENGWAMEALGREFRSPGHVPLLNAADGLVEKRRGHTELTTALLTMAGLTPSATICEMMADDGRALSREDAKRYAAARNLVFLEGRDVVEAWRARSG
jgi:3,4-dihydroxy 2-butanone 4-phosphate synthase